MYMASYSIDDSRPVDTLILSITARDPTPDGPLAYEIRGDGLGPSFFQLVMNNGAAEIRVNRSLDEDSNNTPMYTVRLHAYRVNDPNIYTEHIMSISVTRNPSAPRFLHGDITFYINENHPLETLVGRVNATDDDTGRNGELIFSINEVDPLYTKNYFVVNEVTGEIRLIGNLLEDVSMLYRMEIAATDRGVPQRNAYVTVYIDVTRNGGAPSFINSPYNVTINETEPINTFVIRVTATDPDNEAVFYSLQDTPPASLYFRMDNRTGEIFTNAILYEDTVNSYTVKVYAYDVNPARRSSEAQVTVYINRNPNPPVFTQTMFNLSISEYSSIGLSVVTVSATDADPRQSNGGVLRYSFGNVSPNRAQTLFDVSPTTGEITVASQLYNDVDLSPTSVMLEVLSYDRSVAPKTSTATVYINIVRNMYAPSFTNGNYYSLSVYDRSFVPVNLLELPVTEPDSNVRLNQDTPNAEVYYYLKDDGLAANYFEITQTGTLRLISNLYLPNVETTYINVSTPFH